MWMYLKRFAADEEGATAIEYGLIAVFMGIGAIAALYAIRAGLLGLLGSVAAGFP